MKMSKKALVVDNDFFFVEFLSELLEDRGYEVAKAGDGKEAISRLEAGSFDLIFVDLIMPKIDGRQFIEFARKRYPEPAFSIIAMSATFVEQPDDIKGIGADYYLAKGPMETMAEYVNHLMDKLEKEPLPDHGEEPLIEPSQIYPRFVTDELMESVKFHKAALEGIGVGVMIVDKDARIIVSNSLALEITNRSLDEVLNRPVTSVFPPRERERLVKTLKDIIRDRALRKLAFEAVINAQVIRVIVSVLRVNEEVAGWIMAMEESERWAGQV
jgi:PAS domain S-box-containing protein